MKVPVLDARVTWAVAEMHSRLAQPLNIADLAAEVNLSPSRFRHLFIAQTSLSPSQYLRRMRLRRARLLVEGTFLTVKEVMALVGYNDPSHFSRDFKQFHHALPSSLRGRGAAPGLANSPRHRRFRQSRDRDPGARCA